MSKAAYPYIGRDLNCAGWAKVNGAWDVGEALKPAVDRFLAWKLPADFHPDCGISFEPDYNQHTPWPAKHEPVGTNLLTAEQARAMLEHCVGPELTRLRAALADAERERDGWKRQVARADQNAAEQVTRANAANARAEANAKDAARWQWWRRYAVNHDYQNDPQDADEWADRGIAAVDAAAKGATP